MSLLYGHVGAEHQVVRNPLYGRGNPDVRTAADSKWSTTNPNYEPARTLCTNCENPQVYDHDHPTSSYGRENPGVRTPTLTYPHLWRSLMYGHVEQEEEKVRQPYFYDSRRSCSPRHEKSDTTECENPLYDQQRTPRATAASLYTNWREPSIRSAKTLLRRSRRRKPLYDHRQLHGQEEVPGAGYDRGDPSLRSREPWGSAARSRYQRLEALEVVPEQPPRVARTLSTCPCYDHPALTCP